MKANIKKIYSTMKDETFFKKLGLRIAQLRKDAGLTQSELASQLGLKHQQVLASYESAIRRVPSSLLVPLCQAFNLTVDELLQVKPSKQKPGPAPKLERQLQQVSKLPKAQQQFVSQFIDTVLASEATK